MKLMEHLGALFHLYQMDIKLHIYGGWQNCASGESS